MKPVLYRYRDSESVIKAMEGYTPGEGWTPMYDQAAMDAALERMTKDAKEWGDGLNTAGWAYVDSFCKNVNEPMSGKHYNNCKAVVRDALLAYFDAAIAKYAAVRTKEVEVPDDLA